ncbi:hypothetical protein [Azospirillum doebereinerae]
MPPGLEFSSRRGGRVARTGATSDPKHTTIRDTCDQMNIGTPSGWRSEPPLRPRRLSGIRSTLIGHKSKPRLIKIWYGSILPHGWYCRCNKQAVHSC